MPPICRHVSSHHPRFGFRYSGTERCIVLSHSVRRKVYSWVLCGGRIFELACNSALNRSHDRAFSRGYFCFMSRYQTSTSSSKSAEISAIFLFSGVLYRKNRSSMMVIQALTFSLYRRRKTGNLIPVKGLYNPSFLEGEFRRVNSWTRIWFGLWGEGTGWLRSWNSQREEQLRGRWKTHKPISGLSGVVSIGDDEAEWPGAEGTGGIAGVEGALPDKNCARRDTTLSSFSPNISSNLSNLLSNISLSWSCWQYASSADDIEWKRRVVGVYVGFESWSPMWKTVLFRFKGHIFIYPSFFEFEWFTLRTNTHWMIDG